MVFTFVQFCFPLELLRLANTFQVKHDHQQTRLGWQNSVKLQQQCHFVAPCKNLNYCYFTENFCQIFKRIGNIDIHYKNRRKQMCNGSLIRYSLQFHFTNLISILFLNKFLIDTKTTSIKQMVKIIKLNN